MKKLTILLALLLASNIVFSKDATVADFPALDKVSELLWKEYKPNVIIGEKYQYRVSYIGISVGTVTMETLPLTEIDGDDIYQIKSHLKSSSYYRFIYSLNDTLTSFISKSTFIPRKFILDQDESNKKIILTQSFDTTAQSTSWVTAGTAKGRKVDSINEIKVPNYFQDTFSAIYFVRGLPLKKGDQYFFPVINKNKIMVAKIHVVSEESVVINDKKITAMKIVASDISSKYTDGKTKIELWFEKDGARRMLKFEATIRIGTVEGILIKDMTKK